jgi:hypothetical protein
MNIDMSSSAVASRLRQASQLRRLCLSLANTPQGRDMLRRLNPDDPARRRVELALGIKDLAISSHHPDLAPVKNRFADLVARLRQFAL